MKKLKIFIICFVGVFGGILMLDLNDNWWAVLGGIACLILAIYLYYRWNFLGELDGNELL